VTLYDARDLDPLEREALASSRVVHLVSADRLRAVDFGARPVHVHIDADIINPLEAPAVPYPAAGGPGVVELETALRGMTTRSRVVSVSLTTWSLNRDSVGCTEEAVRRVLHAVLGDGVVPGAAAATTQGNVPRG
jgi:arginase